MQKIKNGDRRKEGGEVENKVAIFYIKKKDDGSIYTKIIENTLKQTLFPKIKVNQQT